MWAENLVELSNHELPVVRRNLVPSLREYFETFPDDTRKLLPVMWQDGDEVVRTRMRELLIKMSDISSSQFVRITDLNQHGCDLSALWRLMDARARDPLKHGRVGCPVRAKCLKQSKLCVMLAFMQALRNYLTLAKHWRLWMKN